MELLRQFGVPIWPGSDIMFSDLRFLIFSFLVIIILLFMPEGFAVWVRDKLERECPRCKQLYWRGAHFRNKDGLLSKYEGLIPDR